MATLSADDLLALQAIADIDDADEVVSNDENDAKDVKNKADSDFGSENDSLFDFIEDDGEWTSVSFAHDEWPNAAQEQATTNDRANDSHATGVDESAPSVARRSSGLKRPASSSEDTAKHSMSGRPAKLEKSFSEGLDELFGRVSLDTIPDDEPPTPQRRQPVHQANDYDAEDLDAQLAVEEDIKSYMTTSAKAKSPSMSLPDFQIPPDVLENAISSNKSGVNAYWSHTLYRGPHGQSVTLLYARNKEQSEKIARSMLNEPILGFDLEWATSGPLKGIKREVSLVQLACQDRTALFHIALHEGDTVEELFAPSLRKILESPDIIKTGVCVWRADGSRLLRVCNIRCQSLIELSHMHQVAYKVDIELITEEMMSLARQTKHVLGMPLEKDQNVRASRWELELNEKQVLYAANDAYVGYMLYRHLDWRRFVKWPERKRPQFAELRIKMRQQYRPTQAGEDDTREELPLKGVNHDLDDTGPDSLPRASTKQENIFTDDREATLYRALCEHRANVEPAYRHTNPARLPNETILSSIAVARPTTKEALARIRGVGPTKISAHGDVWLRIVRDHLHLWTTSEPERSHTGVTVKDEDDGAFEMMNKDKNRRVSVTRWVV